MSRFITSFFLIIVHLKKNFDGVIVVRLTMMEEELEEQEEVEGVWGRNNRVWKYERRDENGELSKKGNGEKVRMVKRKRENYDKRKINWK